MAKAAPRRKTTSSRYQNQDFLKALGEHCRRLRLKAGYSIDRMAKESDQLSPSVIHRLESGSGAVTVSALQRFAQILELHPRDLLDFPLPSEASANRKLVADDDPRVKKEAFKTLFPVYSLKAAAGYFGSGEEVEKRGWVELKGERGWGRDVFVAQAVGDSMSPRIRDGDWLLFRANPAGTRQGKIVLVQYRGPADPDTGGAFTVKVYSSAKLMRSTGEWRHRQIVLSPLNPEYEPIVIESAKEGDFKVVGEYLQTV